MNSNEPSDVDSVELRLLQRATDGDRDAWRDLFVTHRDVAHAVAFRITSNRDDAMDVVQDSFIKAFERLGDFRKSSGFRTWLLRIVHNASLDLLRSKRVRYAVSLDGTDDQPGAAAVIPDTSAAATCAATDESTLARLQDAIAALPTAQQSVFALYACGELTYGEIAAVVGIPIGTVMSRIHHARKQLQELLVDIAPLVAKDSGK